MTSHDNVTEIVQLTAEERELLESQLHWVPCPHCKGESASFEGGDFCPACSNQGRVLKSTANVLASFLSFYDAAQSDLATLRKQLENAREALREYLEAEEIDDPAIRMQELSVCREQARKALSATKGDKS